VVTYFPHVNYLEICMACFMFALWHRLLYYVFYCLFVKKEKKKKKKSTPISIARRHMLILTHVYTQR